VRKQKKNKREENAPGNRKKLKGGGEREGLRTHLPVDLGENETNIQVGPESQKSQKGEGGKIQR